MLYYCTVCCLNVSRIASMKRQERFRRLLMHDHDLSRRNHRASACFRKKTLFKIHKENQQSLELLIMFLRNVLLHDLRGFTTFVQFFHLKFTSLISEMFLVYSLPFQPQSGQGCHDIGVLTIILIFKNEILIFCSYQTYDNIM